MQRCKECLSEKARNDVVRFGARVGAQGILEVGVLCVTIVARAWGTLAAAQNCSEPRRACAFRRLQPPADTRSWPPP
eukprot:15259239-Alexandrium_andersonii.AAC.1